MPNGDSMAPGVLELRIHGVHGTSPQSMLGVTVGDIGQVAGDGITGIYRAKDGHPLPLRKLPPNVAVEAYSWGGLTSSVKGAFGWLIRAGWFLLLPFALANLSYWARPEVGFRGGSHRGETRRTEHDRKVERAAAVFGARLVRVAAGLLTVFFVLTPLTVGVDLVAWQCFRGGSNGCPSLPLFGFLADGWFADYPQRRFAVGASPALLAILVLWLLSRQSLARYESVSESVGGAAAVPKHDDGMVLRHESLWSGTRRTQRLRRLHITVALCVVVCYTAIPMLFGTYTGGRDLWDQGFWQTASVVTPALLALLVLLWVLLYLLPSIKPGDIESKEPAPNYNEPDDVRKVTIRTVEFAVLLVILQLILLCGGSSILPAKLAPLDDGAAMLALGHSGQGLPGENVWFVGLFVLLTAITATISMVGRTSLFGASAVGAVLVGLLLLTSRYLIRSPREDVGPSSLWPAAVGNWALLVLFALLGVLLVWGRNRERGNWRRREKGSRYRKQSGEIAWGGAASSVLLAASVWTGLLFTTSVVAYSGDFLNGDQSVAALGAAVVASDGSGSDQTPVYKAAGDVMLSHADIVTRTVGSKLEVRVYSGRVKVGSWRGSNDPKEVSLPDRDLLHAILILPPNADVIEYTKSCVREAPTAVWPPAEPCKKGAREQLDAPTKGRLGLGTAKVPPGGARVEESPVQVTPGPRRQALLLLPQVLIWAPLGQLALVLFGTAGALWMYRRVRNPDNKELITKMVGDDRRIAPDDQRSCIDARVRALLPHRAETVAGWIGVITVGVSFVVIFGALTGRPPWDLFGKGGPIREVTHDVAALSLWVCLGSALALVWLGSQMRSSENTRKGVGILWDLTTFWPRAAHPLSPPCYAERVIPEVVRRIKWALKKPDEGGPSDSDPSDPRYWGGADHVIVSAHSQGSTLAVAAASRLEEDELERVCLITYGSQLRTWYGRVFPGVFGSTELGYEPTDGRTKLKKAFPDARDDPSPEEPASPCLHRMAPCRCRTGPPMTHALRCRLEGPDGPPRWINLFRRTDPIGFRVFSDADTSSRDIAVLEVPEESRGDAGPKIMAHGEYQHSPEYIAVVQKWTREESVTPSSPPVISPPMLPEP